MFNLTPWKKQSQREVSEFREKFDNMIDRFFDNDFFPAGEDFFEKSLHPKLNISEGKKAVTVKAEIPGVEAEDIDVSVSGRRLTIKGQKKREKEEKGENYHLIEQSYGYFNRSIELPAEVDENDVKASYKKGILRITLKKTKESSFRKIEVRTA